MKTNSINRVELFYGFIAKTEKQDSHITWPVSNAEKRSYLKSFETVAAKLQHKVGNQVRLEALERTDGKRVEIALFAIFEHPELPLGSSSANEILQQINAALQVLRELEASPAPAELISISSGDPAQSSESIFRAPEKIAELATLLRTHLPPCELRAGADDATSFSFVPKRGSSEILEDSQDLVLSGEVLAVNDKTRTMLLRGPDGQCSQLHIPLSEHFRERLLEAQLYRKSVELRVTPSYQLENGARKMRGGTLQEIIRTIDIPVQRSLVD
ncbi:hypothetical protein HG264_14080 [Pseudomonas sp. gcc21]|uniref:hypothetical protein n=1 Tax=Pseudomonas sp. gcc21 TaxID=2726989 RepID=UPI0014519420|nr:hypothetical protein [Pseudomonas sp. gcc21]QJD59948.1 hypothetical protein HG264_14080 [Pseudomonas sp. gcc21]